MLCPDDELIARQLRGALDPATAADVDAHVAACAACRELIVELARMMPSGDGRDVPMRALEPGDSVGRYRIVAIVGRGAMGIVYRATDRELRRAVAIKIVSPRVEDDDAARARLVREARAMARLQHPNVVPVFDVGTVGADVFVAMELVQGCTLREWLATAERTRSEILDVFDGIARGLAAAHEAGVVHRDVKPENVLVRDDGRAFVADFGLARAAFGEAIESTQRGSSGSGARPSHLTTTGALVGTPRYMAPEQLVPGCRVDARADQFAYCVMLFEALFGAHPFPATRIEALAEAVRSGAPAIPDGARVPARLRAVVLRGLAVDPGARWPSMQALADALRARRRRWIAGAVIAGALVLASAAWAGREAPAGLCEDPDRAVPTSAIADARVVERTEAWARAWVAAVGSACAEADRTRRDLAMQCLLRRRSEVAALVEQRDADPLPLLDAIASLPRPDACAEVDREPIPPDDRAHAVADVRAEIDRVRARMLVGDPTEVVVAATRARDRAQALTWDPILAEAELLLGESSVAAGDNDRAEAALQRAVDLAVRAEADRTAVAALTALADVVGTRGSRFEEGTRAIRQAQAILDRGELDAKARVRLLVVEGRMKIEQQDFAGSRDCARRALAIVGDADDPLAHEVKSQLAMAHIQLGELDEGERLLWDVLEAREALYGGPHPRTVETFARLGIVLRRQHRTRGAIEVLERGLAMAESLHDPMHPNVGMMLSNLGLARTEAFEVDAAVPLLERALAVYRAAEGEYGPRVATIAFQLGEALRAAGRLDEAVEHLQRARAIESELYGADDPRTIATTHAIAGLAIDREQWAAAEAMLGECLAACERAGGGADYLVPDLLGNLAHVLHRQGRLEEARDRMQAAIARGGDARSSFHANKQHGLGTVLFDLGDYAGAVAALELAVEIRTELGDPMLPESQALLARARAEQAVRSSG